MKRNALSLLATVALSALSAAQMVPPPAELKQLEPYLGSYEGVATTTMGDMKIHMKSEWAEAGMFFKTVSTMKVGEIAFTETMFTGWDSKLKKFKSYAFQSMVPAPRIEITEIKGDTLTAISEPWEMMGMTYTSRGTSKKLKDGNIEFKLEFKMGDSWQEQGKAVLKKIG